MKRPTRFSTWQLSRHKYNIRHRQPFIVTPEETLLVPRPERSRPIRALHSFHPSQGKYCGPRLAPSAHQNLYRVLTAIVQQRDLVAGQVLAVQRHVPHAYARKESAHKLTPPYLNCMAINCWKRSASPRAAPHAKRAAVTRAAKKKSG